MYCGWGDRDLFPRLQEILTQLMTAASFFFLFSFFFFFLLWIQVNWSFTLLVSPQVLNRQTEVAAWKAEIVDDVAMLQIHSTPCDFFPRCGPRRQRSCWQKRWRFWTRRPCCWHKRPQKLRRRFTASKFQPLRFVARCQTKSKLYFVKTGWRRKWTVSAQCSCLLHNLTESKRRSSKPKNN